MELRSGKVLKEYVAPRKRTRKSRAAALASAAVLAALPVTAETGHSIIASTKEEEAPVANSALCDVIPEIESSSKPVEVDGPPGKESARYGTTSLESVPEAETAGVEIQDGNAREVDQAQGSHAVRLAGDSIVEGGDNTKVVDALQHSAAVASAQPNKRIVENDDNTEPIEQHNTAPLLRSPRLADNSEDVTIHHAEVTSHPLDSNSELLHQLDPGHTQRLLSEHQQQLEPEYQPNSTTTSSLSSPNMSSSPVGLKKPREDELSKTHEDDDDCEIERQIKEALDNPPVTQTLEEELFGEVDDDSTSPPANALDGDESNQPTLSKAQALKDELFGESDDDSLFGETDDADSTLPAASSAEAVTKKERIWTQEELLSLQVVDFDYHGAYAKLKHEHSRLSKEYSEKNLALQDAYEEQGKAKEAEQRLLFAKENPNHVTKKRVRRDHAPDEEQHNAADLMMGDNARDGGDEQGSGWTYDDSNEHALDRGTDVYHAGEEKKKKRRKKKPSKGSAALAVSNPKRSGLFNRLAKLQAHKPKFDARSHAYVEDDEDNDDEYMSVTDEDAPPPRPPPTAQELKDAENAIKKLKASCSKITEEMRALKTEERACWKRKNVLEKQFSDLNSTVSSTNANGKRPRDDDDDTLPPNKRVKRVGPIPHSKQDAIPIWHATVTKVLADHANLRKFPRPEYWPCENHGVCEDAKRTLAACEHNLRSACDRLSKSELKKYKVVFHPDRFTGCRFVDEGERKFWQACAGEIFVVVSAMWEERPDKVSEA